MELWGGHECTVVRIGDTFRDQNRLTGHHDRLDDLARFAGLGITRLRYPVLWERVAPDRPGVYDWRWSDERVAEIERLGMRPILGLLHHGSGPHYTSLVDPDFPALFADYAAAAAARYPQVEDWTPINEPLTTARFSTLYGTWYPHTRDETMFWAALFNQIDGIRLAMAAIRAVNPAARLVQTDDLGQTYSTPATAEAAGFYNERRWLSWDLLAGRVVPGHALWERIVQFGMADRARAIADAPCPADVIGVNHYVTSDRFLDDRAGAYDTPLPPDGYHDVTAARVVEPAPDGLEGLLRQAWQRYGCTIAVTESHLGCTREEQMRWVWESWRTCLKLRDEGVDIRALTAWALLGSVDWNSLITVDAGHYEPGAFDTRGGTPRLTALGGLLRQLGAVAARAAPTPDHPVLAGRGWWRRDIRLEHRPYAVAGVMAPRARDEPTRPVLITGATSLLAQAFAAACRLRNLPYVLTDRRMLRIDDAAEASRALDLYQPWAVINVAGWLRIDAAEDDEANCLRINSDGAAILAAACAARGIHYTIFSSALVFDGQRSDGYVESDAPRPLSVFGRSKVVAEERTLGAHSGALVVRTAAFFSPFDERNFAVEVERALRAGREMHAADSYIVTPTFVPDLVSDCLDLVIDGEAGIWHLTGAEPLSWLQFGRRIADALDLDARLLRPASPADLGWKAPRPANGALLSRHGARLPRLDDAFQRHAAHRAGALP